MYSFELTNETDGYITAYEYPLKGVILTRRDDTREFISYECPFDDWLDYSCKLAAENVMMLVNRYIRLEENLELIRKYRIYPYTPSECLRNV
jgi:hypothetical protein